MGQGLPQNQQHRGCGSNEDINYLFLICNVFGTIWTLVSHWLGYVTLISKDHQSIIGELCIFYGYLALELSEIK